MSVRHTLDALVQLAALAAPHIISSDQIIFGWRQVYRAPVACFGSVYVHVAAVIVACFVCIVLFVIVMIR